MSGASALQSLTCTFVPSFALRFASVFSFFFAASMCRAAENGSRPIVYPVPYRTYAGHKADVIDLAWSKANFLLSASIDKTVRLWFE